MRILDSRRLTGPSLMLDGPGAILDVALDGLDRARALEAWSEELRSLLEGLGWRDAPTAFREHPLGLSLAFGAPIDALYAATEVNEAAWHAAALRLGGGETRREHGDDPHDPGLEDPRQDGDELPDREETLIRLRTVVANERKPELVELAERAARHGATLLWDDRRVSVGLGAGSRAWPVSETSAALGRIPWQEVHDIPVALVTGTNGKTTTVRLLGAMVRAAGKTAGVTSTDRVTVGDEIVAVGDYSGPNGARTVLRDRRVEVAILEVARGGILRRGLGVPRASVALVTNVANDHLGEFGIFDLPSLADAKLVVAKAVRHAGGRLVLNADDPLVRERADLPDRRRLLWFTLDPANHVALENAAAGSEVCLLDGEALVHVRGRTRTTLCTVNEVPITLAGRARHNVANALGAIGAALALELSVEAIREGLRSFDNTPDLNPGRGNLWQRGGVTAIVDFAHNPHGLLALADLCRALPAKRRGIVIGQAGDRDDDAIREFARAAWTMRPQRVFIKEMETYLRGREKGVVPAVIESELRRLGAGRDLVTRHASELEAVRAALAWAREGDLLLITTHESREQVIGAVERMASYGAESGQ